MQSVRSSFCSQHCPLSTSNIESTSFEILLFLSSISRRKLGVMKLHADDACLEQIN